VLKIYEAKKQLADRIVEIDKFESVIPILLQGGFPEIDIQNFKAFIVENELSGKTYVKVLEDWKSSKLSLKQDNYDKINFSRLIDIPTAIAQSKEKNKMIFILFTGYSCEECLRLETNILSDVNISKVLAENFVSFIAYVDDKSKIQGSEISRGMQLSEIQKEHFNSFTQPAMYILNTEGKIISELTNVKTINQFSQWLENKY
jgi:thioredoxin-related protein